MVGPRDGQVNQSQAVGGSRKLVDETVRCERRWTTAGATPARELVRPVAEAATFSFDVLKRGVFHSALTRWLGF
jgi:hypothetical protein